MAKNTKAQTNLHDSIALMYGAYLLLHMEKNGLLEKTSKEDFSVQISDASGKAANKSIKYLERNILNAVKIATTSKKTGAILEKKAFSIVDAFFKTGLHKDGVVPPLIFTCLLFVWFVEMEMPTPFTLKWLSDATTYDEVFLSVEEASDSVNWGKHMDAATEAISAVFRTTAIN